MDVRMFYGNYNTFNVHIKIHPEKLEKSRSTYIWFKPSTLIRPCLKKPEPARSHVNVAVVFSISRRRAVQRIQIYDTAFIEKRCRLPAPGKYRDRSCTQGRGFTM